MRILLVEDERKLSAVIKRGLKEVHYAVDIAENGYDALFMAREPSFTKVSEGKLGFVKSHLTKTIEKSTTQGDTFSMAPLRGQD